VPVRALVETESAALGAALQALWAVRRDAGERTLRAHDVAAPFVRTGEASCPDAHAAPLHQELRARFREQVERLHGPVA
jgi:sugar (pentulose or hexulose) kinase